MIIKKQKSIIFLFLLLIILGVFIFTIIRFNGIRDYQYYSNETKGYAMTIKEIQESDYDCLSSVSNLCGLAYFNKAKLFFKEENYQKAEIAFNKSIRYLKKEPNGEYNLFLSFIYNNLAWTYYNHALSVKSTTRKKELFKNAIMNFKQVSNTLIDKNKHLFEKIQCDIFISNSLKHLGLISIQEGNFKDAKDYFIEAEKKLIEVNNVINKSDNENNIINSSHIWCSDDTVIHYFNVINSDKDYHKFKKSVIAVSDTINKELKNKLKQ